MLAVWEPVLPMDLGPPRSSALARLSDARVEQFWDKKRLTSEALMTAARKHPERVSPADAKQLAKAKVVWDFIGMFPAGVGWTNEAPFPQVSGHPVVNAIGEIEKGLVAVGGGRK